MPANTDPIFPNVLNTGRATISTANTNRDGSGTIATVFTAGANGSRIEKCYIQAIGTTTAGQVRLYYHDGTNYYLIEEVAVTAATPSASVQAFAAQVTLLEGFLLPAGHTIRASTHNAESFNVVITGADY